jgi:DNA-binding Lrp family transcriptional regulator
MKEEFEDLKIAEKTIYKRLKRLKDIGVIKDETSRQTAN